MHKILLAIAAMSTLTLSGCGGNSDSGATAAIANTATSNGFTLSVFAKAPAATQKPDSIVEYSNSVFIGYQQVGDVKDDSNPSLTNVVVQYDLKGNVLKTYTAPGHVDGLLARSDTNELWVMSNEDGNPELTIINLNSGVQKSYTATVNPTAHGGGFDDMQLINGVVYASASNPTTPGSTDPRPTARPSASSSRRFANGPTADHTQRPKLGVPHCLPGITSTTGTGRTTALAASRPCLESRNHERTS